MSFVVSGARVVVAVGLLAMLGWLAFVAGFSFARGSVSTPRAMPDIPVVTIGIVGLLLVTAGVLVAIHDRLEELYRAD